MFELFGPKWTFQYTEARFKPQITKYRLREVVTGEQHGQVEFEQE